MKRTCKECKGEGQTVERVNDAFETVICPVCEGTGKVETLKKLPAKLGKLAGIT